MNIHPTIKLQAKLIKAMNIIMYWLMNRGNIVFLQKKLNDTNLLNITVGRVSCESDMVRKTLQRYMGIFI